jgi:hypothetical protein
MRHLIIGAGATLAEALNHGCPAEFHPPLIRDFARKTWMNYSPHPVLEAYLHELGHVELGDDPRELFYRLEEDGTANIERFLEFAWVNRNRPWKADLAKVPPGFISGLRIAEAGESSVQVTRDAGGGFWDNLLYHGVGSPLQFLMLQCFFENGSGWKDFALSKRVAGVLAPGDLVLNLNYDTVFELALRQANRPFAYSPNVPDAHQILVCKPHGSLNMVSNDQSFTFGQPEWLGMPQRQGFRSYSGLIPPRLNKSYSQHPIARMILEPVTARAPEQLAIWGVGLTESDVDLTELYRAWASHAREIEVINPSQDVAERVRALVSCNVVHFSSVTEWERGHC